MARHGEPIPRYHLYGDDADVRPFEFVHVERLRDRSERHDWSIEAHTHVGLAQLALFVEGGAELHIDGVSTVVTAPAAVTIPSGAVHALDVVPASTGFVVMLVDDQLDGARLGRWLDDTLFAAPAMLPLDERTADEARQLCGQLLHEQQTLDTAHEAVTHWLTLSLLTLLARRAEATSIATNLRGIRFREFRHLVEDHFGEHRPVSWYAGRLHVSESSLNRCCDDAADRTAFEVIQDRIELEARRRLRYTTVPVTTLAHDLGFDDQSYFSRFFRRRTGSSPSEFRQASEGARG